ncbi:MAG: hypothetical protein ACPKPY_09865 [Nitrososphaeraceae archaeon]
MSHINNSQSDKIKFADEESRKILDEIKQQNESLEPAYVSLQKAINQYEQQGGDIEEILPSGLGGSGLGFSLFKKNRKGEGFFRSFLNGIKDDLCDQNGELREFMKDSTNMSVSAVISFLVSTVSLPLAFIPPIAAIIVSKGIKYWCKISNE